MHTGGYVGRVGALAVTLGIGSAVSMGMGCAVASAKPSHSSPSGDHKSSEAGSGTSTAKKHSTRAERHRHDRQTTRRRHAAHQVRRSATTEKSVDATHPVALSEKIRPRSGKIEHAGQKPRRVLPRAARPSRQAHEIDVRQPTKPASSERVERSAPPAVGAALDNAFDAVTAIPKSVFTTGARALPPVAPTVPAQPQRPRPTADAGLTVVKAVSAAIVSVLNPLSVTTTPGAPSESPAAWALLAAARREFDGAIGTPQRLLGNVRVTAQAETAAGPVALAPGIVVPPEIADHVATTPGPSLIDQVTVLAMDALKQVSKAIGVNITMKLGELVTAPEPPWFTTIGLDVAKDTYEGGDVWVITPPDATGERVIAVHGSGFVYAPNIIHWMDYTQMARETGATIVVPRYPLIPEGGNAENSVPPMAEFIADQVETYGAENVSIYADSAGGNLSVLAVQKIVRDCHGSASCLASRVPSRMVLLSPALDGKNMYSDPNVELTNDPVTWIPENERDYYGSWSTGPEELWNPMLGPTDGMPPTTIYVGSREQAAPGDLLYAARMLGANPDAEVDVVIGMGQIHDWAQGGLLPLNSQAANYRDDIYRQLGLVDDAAELAVDA